MLFEAVEACREGAMEPTYVMSLRTELAELPVRAMVVVACEKLLARLALLPCRLIVATCEGRVRAFGSFEGAMTSYSSSLICPIT